MLPDDTRLPAHARSAKTLDRMNSLRDMGHFPVAVHAGATLNVLITVAATLWIRNHYGQYALALPCWIAVVLTLNGMPVLGLRAVHWQARTPVPQLRTMNFFHDQHRFADWVYLAASANMAFWIALSWCAYTLLPGAWTLPVLLLVAFTCTLAPVWLRMASR